jgi:hypothetical protein
MRAAKFLTASPGVFVDDVRVVHHTKETYLGGQFNGRSWYNSGSSSTRFAFGNLGPKRGRWQIKL